LGAILSRLNQRAGHLILGSQISHRGDLHRAIWCPGSRPRPAGASNRLLVGKLDLLQPGGRSCLGFGRDRWPT
jgi:hypothetical protein